MVVAKEKPFATEVELCSAFLAAVGSEWTAYNEHAGWDILLVRNSDGFQIGIEAKLRLNAHVITQAIEEYGSYSAERAGPDCRAVLVPEGDSGGFGAIAAYIGITVIRCRPVQTPRRSYGHAFSPSLPSSAGDRYLHDDWHEWCPAKRHKLPEYVPDVKAGSPSPLQLTTWKISAIKIAVTLEKRGYVTRSDFKHIGIDHRRWVASATGWLKTNLDGGYVQGPHLPDFKRQHPRVYEQIAAEAEKWMPPALQLTTRSVD